MGRRTVHECDRCKREFSNGLEFTRKAKLVISVNKGEIELCKGCGDKLERFLKGQDCFTSHPDPDP